MSRFTIVLVAVAFLSAGRTPAAFAQAAQETVQSMPASADPSFAAATIKPSKPDEVIKSIQPAGYRTTLPMITMLKMLSFAYDLQNEQIAGAPQWADTENYDLNGVADLPGKPDVKQLRVMLQKLLVERCALKFHWEERQLPAYVLTVGRSGPKLSKSADDLRALPSFALKMKGTGAQTVTAKNAPLLEFAHMMQSTMVDRPVVDQTGLIGNYDFALTWMADDSQSAQPAAGVQPPNEATDAPGLFTALQEQLGLKLSAQKAAVGVMVIDRMERPSPN